MQTEFRFGSVKLRLVKSRISEYLGEGSVAVSDDNFLSHGGGASADVWAHVGDELAHSTVVREVRQGHRPHLAQVLSSPIGSERESYVFHCITLDFDEGRDLRPADTLALYNNLLAAAAELDVRTLAITLLGTGAAGLPVAMSVTALIDAIESRGLVPLPIDVTVACIDENFLEEVSSLIAAKPVTQQYVLGRLTKHEYRRDVRDVASEFVSSEDLANCAFNAVRLFDVVFARAHKNAKSAESDSPAARMARNRISNGDPATLDLVIDVIRGVHSVIDNAGKSLLNAKPEIAWDLMIQSLPVDPDFTVVSDSSPRAQSRPSDPHGTEHVRQLRNLLLESMDENVQHHAAAYLRKQKFKGSFETQLLEYCATRDPLEVIKQFMNIWQVQEVLERLLVTGISAEGDECYWALLSEIGFPRHSEILDPAALSAQVRTFRMQIERHDAPHLQIVTQISVRVERILRVYLRFLSLGFLGVPPEKWFEDRSAVHHGWRRGFAGGFSRMTMGNLIYALKAVAEDISKSKDPAVIARRHEFGAQGKVKQWFPSSMVEFSRSRNMWIHGDVEEASDVEQRTAAIAFCDLCESLLKGLERGPYPHVIRIEEVTYDRWNRRHITALDSAGHTERLFTSADVRPGQIFLMRTKSNPLRVDPLLVPLGSSAS